MMLTAEWTSRNLRADQHVLNMSGICTEAPPHLDAHDNNSMYCYLY